MDCFSDCVTTHFWSDLPLLPPVERQREVWRKTLKKSIIHDRVRPMRLFRCSLKGTLRMIQMSVGERYIYRLHGVPNHAQLEV